jgi:hypothetical protein
MDDEIKGSDIYKHLFEIKPGVILDNRVSCEFVCKLCKSLKGVDVTVKQALTKGYENFKNHLKTKHAQEWVPELKRRMRAMQSSGPMDR